jgi:hypothetical protein
MRIWQVDLYRRPLKTKQGDPLWELVICDASDRSSLSTTDAFFNDFCPQPEVSSEWAIARLKEAGDRLPDMIQVFRPQTLNIISQAAASLGIPVEATRRTFALKRSLIEMAQEYPYSPNYKEEPYDPLAVDRPPPLPLPENLWGEQWRFATTQAGALMETFEEFPIPIKYMPEFLTPIQLGLASTVAVPGIVIYGGRQSMQLAQWLQENKPFAINYIPGQPDGLILESGLCDRWVMATFDDVEMAAAGQTYQSRKKLIKGLHFLLVQPDESGMTYSGFWLLQD